MNLQRGIIRLLAVLTVLWVVPLGWLFWGDLVVGDKFEPMTEAQFAELNPECIEASAADEPFCETRAALLGVGIKPREEGIYWPDLVLSSIVVLGPPALAWFLLLTGFWIAAGFRP